MLVIVSCCPRLRPQSFSEGRGRDRGHQGEEEEERGRAGERGKRGREGREGRKTEAI